MRLYDQAQIRSLGYGKPTSKGPLDTHRAMRAFAWLLCIALALAMPSGNTVPRTIQNSQRTTHGVDSGDDEHASPLQLRTRTITGAKTYSLKKSIEAVKDSGHPAIHGSITGRPIWREIRESVFSTLNQVGGEASVITWHKWQLTRAMS
jgi:hypothetical protein